VQLEVLNTTLWPDFPYKGVARYADVWMPMSYYTYRSAESGLRNAYRYTVDSVDRCARASATTTRRSTSSAVSPRTARPTTIST
jgi:hypothetical protein